MIKAIKLGALAVGIAASFAMAQSAQADTMKIHRDTTNYTADVGGGEFGVYDFTPISGIATATTPMKFTDGTRTYDFQTFCMQSATDVEIDTNVNWAISTKVDFTGKSLTAGVAYLYTNFWNATGFSATGKSMLADGSGIDNSSSSSSHSYTYNYTGGVNRVASAKDMQEAIWWLQGEWQNTFSTITANARELVNIATLQTTTGGSWFNQYGAGGIGGVRVLVITSLQGAAEQDVLVLVPIPLPSSALLGLGLMAGLGAVGIVRRRRTQTLA